MSDHFDTFTDAIEAVAGGRANAADHVLPQVYDELKALANEYLRHDRPGHTLQPAALVHEAYLRLVDQSRATWRNRAHFLAIASTAIRRVLVDHARSRNTRRRSVVGTRLSGLAADRVPGPDGSMEPRLDDLDEALARLADQDLRQARVVELRFFGGLSISETAEALGVSEATVERDWAMARAWLFSKLSGHGGNGADGH